MCSANARSSCAVGASASTPSASQLVGQAGRLGQRARLRGDVVGDQQRGARGDRAARSCTARRSGSRWRARRPATWTNVRLGLHRRELGRREEAGGAVQPVARVVVAQHAARGAGTGTAAPAGERPPVKPCSCAAARRARCLAASISQRDVVAAVVGVGADRVGLRQRPVVDHGCRSAPASFRKTCWRMSGMRARCSRVAPAAPRRRPAGRAP